MSEKRQDQFFRYFINEIAKEVAQKIASQGTEPDVLSAKTIARRLDCSTSEVRKHIQENGIKTVPFGRSYRVPREEFEKHLERWKNGGSLWD